MTQPTEAPQGASLNQQMVDCANLTTLRNNANDALLAWISFQRSIEKIRAIYITHQREERLISWLNSGHEGAVTRIAELTGIVESYDERLTILTAKIRQEYLGDMEL